MLKDIGVVALIWLAVPTVTYADEVYCEAPGITLYDGSDQTIDWTVTTNKARKVQKIGQEKPTRGCSRDFRTIGTIISREVIKKASLGQFRAVNKYRVYYEADKPGTDEVAYKTTWEQSGKIVSAIVRIKIRVVDRPI